MDTESIFYDGDDSINLDIELTESGLDIDCSNENGIHFGTVFSIEDLEVILAKMKRIDEIKE